MVLFYASGTLNNGIYILDMFNPILNVNGNKRPKGGNLKSSFLALSPWPYKQETKQNIDFG